MDDNSARPAQAGNRRTVLRCLSIFVALLVVLLLEPQGIVATLLLVLGSFQLVELVDRSVIWLQSRRSRHSVR